MKLTASMLMLAATAGIAALAATTNRNTERREAVDAPEPREAAAPQPVDSDAWFV